MKEFDRKVKKELDQFLTENIHLSRAEKVNIENKLPRSVKKKKEKIMYYGSILLSLGILLIFAVFAVEKYYPFLSTVPNATENPPNVEQKQSEEEIRSELINVVKGYSAAVQKVVFAEKDDYSMFIDYHSFADVKAEFINYMDEAVIIDFLKKYNIYEKEDGLYILGSGYIPMTFMEGEPYEITKDNDNQYTLTQDQNTDFFGHRVLTVKFHKQGEKWILSPPED